MSPQVQTYNASVDYDKRFDMLSVRRPGFKTSYNLVLGNLTLDFYKKELIGVDVQDARQWFSDLFGRPDIKPDQILNAKINFIERKSLMAMFILFKLDDQTLSKEFVLPKFNSNPVPFPA